MCLKDGFKAVVFVSTMLLLSCAESDEMARKKLDVILNDDLAAIVEGVESEALLDTPFFELTQYQTYNEGRYIRRAEVDFFFLKGIDYKIIRKYRYHKATGMWERYYNQYRTFSSTEDEEEND